MRKLLVLLLLLLTAGCMPQTRMSTFTDPDFTDTNYHRILIAPTYEHLDQRGLSEEIFSAAFADTDITVLGSIQLLMPTRDYNDDQFFDVLAQNDIDAVLNIHLTEFTEEIDYVPETYYSHFQGVLSSGIYSRPRHFAYPEYYAGYSGGYYIRSPRVRHELVLFDVATRRPAWIAGALTAANPESRFPQLSQSLAQKTVQKLIADGFINTNK